MLLQKKSCNSLSDFFLRKFPFSISNSVIFAKYFSFYFLCWSHKLHFSFHFEKQTKKKCNLLWTVLWVKFSPQRNWTNICPGGGVLELCGDLYFLRPHSPSWENSHARRPVSTCSRSRLRTSEDHFWTRDLWPSRECIEILAEKKNAAGEANIRRYAKKKNNKRTIHPGNVMQTQYLPVFSQSVGFIRRNISDFDSEA